MLVTLFVDASYYWQTHSAAYALYAISSIDRLQFSGRFKGHIESSVHAELAAIANALHIVMPHRLAAGASKVLIQSDCLAAIGLIQSRTSRHHQEIVDFVHNQAGKYGVAIELRHVPAHAGVAEPRLYCQDWCDSECRRLASLMHSERRQKPSRRPRKRRRSYAKSGGHDRALAKNRPEG